MLGGEAGLRLRSSFIDQEGEQNQMITITLMRWEVARNGLLSPHAGDVYSGAPGYPRTMDRPILSPHTLRRWPNPVNSTALGALYVAPAPEKLSHLLPQVSESATGPCNGKQEGVDDAGMEAAAESCASPRRSGYLHDCKC